MTAAMIGYAAAGVSELKRTPDSSSPSAIAAAATVGSRSSRAITRAASACSSAGRPAAYPTGTPMIPLRRNSATNDIAAAIAHTNVFSRPTGMPSIAARSPRSALARMATPYRLRARNQATPTIISGATISAIRWFALRITWPTVSFQPTGGAMRSLARLRPHHRGIRMPITTNSCVMPSVATVTTSRGE